MNGQGNPVEVLDGNPDEIHDALFYAAKDEATGITANGETWGILPPLPSRAAAIASKMAHTASAEAAARAWAGTVQELVKAGNMSLGPSTVALEQFAYALNEDGAPQWLLDLIAQTAQAVRGWQQEAAAAAVTGSEG